MQSFGVVKLQLDVTVQGMRSQRVKARQSASKRVKAHHIALALPPADSPSSRSHPGRLHRPNSHCTADLPCSPCCRHGAAWLCCAAAIAPFDAAARPVPICELSRPVGRTGREGAHRLPGTQQAHGLPRFQRQGGRAWSSAIGTGTSLVPPQLAPNPTHGVQSVGYARGRRVCDYCVNCVIIV